MQKPDAVAIQCSTRGRIGDKIICLRLSGASPMEVKATILVDDSLIEIKEPRQMRLSANGFAGLKIVCSSPPSQNIDERASLKRN
jgi:hypothetical protein